ncbi:MAG: Hsp70 family protein [Pirellulaceae bacterium]
MTAKYVIGIDLGTTNSVLAYAPLGLDTAEVMLLPIPQVVAPNTIESRNALPSFLYVATEPDRAGDALAVPWSTDGDSVVGAYAREKGAESPQRTIAAAKSWLCHSRVDRRLPILPWNSQELGNDQRMSPVQVTQRYLEHLVATWQAEYADAPFAEQTVVLTVPASFDAAARELTREAAVAAGFPESFVLLEEPQAAVYAWISAHEQSWRKWLAIGDTILVCDVGGGTTDFTLIQVAEESGEMVLQRIAVGNHLLVGGDNMDMAIAYHAAELFAEKGTKLDPWQSVSLWHACRSAKEKLLGKDAAASQPVSVLGRGSRLIGGTVTVDLPRANTEALLVDGFFPKCNLTDVPKRQRASGFQELGLPFESDTAVTRHLAAFLQAHGDGGTAVHPSRVLFNGGVFKAESLRQRLIDTLHHWFSGRDATEVLEGDHDLDYAVARGAAYYGWSKQHRGVRIRGGTSRSYYVGIETSGPAIPGAPRPLHALCVVPFGMEEGTEVDVPSGDIGLVLDEPVQFRFFSSSVRKQDQPGLRLERWVEGELAETDALEATLTSEEDESDSYVPVRFRSHITELGVFELWCVHAATGRKWKLEFSVRDPE